MAIKTIFGASSTDLTTLQGSEIPDLFIVESDKLYINGLEGSDTISGISSIDQLSIESGSDDDKLTFAAEVVNSYFNAGAGDDQVEIQDFLGTIIGGLGNDSIITTDSRTLTESLIRGNAGDDVLIFSNVKNSIINANSDNDDITISGNIVKSELYGGRQKDTITVDKSTTSLIRGDANEDKITINGNLNGTIINGNADNDQIIINSMNIESSTVYGGQGDDKIDISSDAVYVTGGKGNDDINLTSSERHTIYGGRGGDSINSNSTKALFIDAGADQDTIILTGVGARSAIHSVDGGAGNVVLIGKTVKELLDGGTEDNGQDTIDSAGGDDTIYGRAGNDLIKLGSQGNALIHAGADNDVIEVTLASLTYNTTIKGEAGNDTIAVVGTAATFNMWEPNSVAEKALFYISFETLSFGTGIQAIQYQD